MKRLLLPVAVLAVAVAISLLSPVNAQDSSTPGQHDAASLKKSLEELGYEIKNIVTEPGKEKYAVTLEKGGLTLPIGVEISPSRGYLWLTLNLGAAPADSAPASRFAELLKANAQIQPSLFYITKSGRLMIGHPTENRAVTNAQLRRNIEKIADDVVIKKAIWEQSE